LTGEEKREETPGQMVSNVSLGKRRNSQRIKKIASGARKRKQFV